MLLLLPDLVRTISMSMIVKIRKGAKCMSRVAILGMISHSGYRVENRTLNVLKRDPFS